MSTDIAWHSPAVSIQYNTRSFSLCESEFLISSSLSDFPMDRSARLLCGLEGTSITMDRVRIEAFRNCIGKKCSEELNQLVLRSAMGSGFTGIEICAADTTVQASPIAYPTEVGHLKNIAENIFVFFPRASAR